MASLSTAAWFAIAAIGFAAVIAFLYGLAILVRNEDAALELQAEVARVKRDFAAELDERNDSEILVVDEAPPEPAAARAA